MNFEDEPYARLYIRRTLTNRRLRWEGRAVLHEMLYVFDRAGVFEFDGELADAIELMTELPRDVVVVGLQRLLETGTWEARGRFLVWPRFIEAQTATRSDAARQREARERRRAVARASETLGENAPTDVTLRDEPSRPVTVQPETVHDRHEPSRPVTSGHSDLYSALPSSEQTQRAREAPRDTLREQLTTAADELPDSWTPNAAAADLAKRLGLNLDDELGLYRAHRKREGYRCGNWDADFEYWLRQAKKFARERQAKRGTGTATHGGPSDEWPTDEDISLREAIRSGAHGRNLKAKLEAGQLDAQVARRLVRERQAELAERRNETGSSGQLGALVANIGRRIQ